jgi:Iron-containing redox enzyme
MPTVKNTISDNLSLQKYYWPPVNSFVSLDEELMNFFNDPDKQNKLYNLTCDSEAHGAFLNNHLGSIYSYFYGYSDSPCYLNSNIVLELSIQEAKLMLEHSLIHEWLNVPRSPQFKNNNDAIKYLEELVINNLGVSHELFDFIEIEASKESILEFLRLEVLRNEVVDDEVALMIVGLQGNMKKVMVSNLWDECGNGSLTRFHTYWLRQLIDKQLGWDSFLKYRLTKKPWFSAIGSNSLNSLLTRPQYKFRAYGHFLITEAWVKPHFLKIIKGLNRVDMTNNDIQIYFTEHVNIDPYHTKEMLSGIEHQNPPLNLNEIREIVIGAYQAIEANLKQYTLVLKHLKLFF